MLNTRDRSFTINNTKPPFAKAVPPVNLADFTPGIKHPETHFEKFGKFISMIANCEKIVSVKCYDNAIDVITEPKE